MSEDVFAWSLFTSYASLHAGPECFAEGLHGKKKMSLSSHVVNTYRTYFGVEPETVSLLSFSQISRSPEIRKLSVKHSPPPHGTHFASSHLLSSLFVCLFLLFVSGTARQEELPLLPPSCNDAEWCFNVLLCKQTKAQKHYLWNIKLTHSHKNTFSPAVAACVIQTEVILRREVAHFCMTSNCSVARI